MKTGQQGQTDAVWISARGFRESCVCRGLRVLGRLLGSTAEAVAEETGTAIACQRCHYIFDFLRESGGVSFIFPLEDIKFSFLL